MNREKFLRYYPQFTDFPPQIVLRKALKQANARFSDFGEDQEEARRLYIAHKLTMYAYTFPAAVGSGSGNSSGTSDSPSGSGIPSGITVSSLSAAGKASSAQQATSKKVGEVQVTYSSGYSSSSSGASRDSDLADLTETAFGLQLLTLLRLHARPRYIP